MYQLIEYKASYLTIYAGYGQLTINIFALYVLFHTGIELASRFFISKLKSMHILPSNTPWSLKLDFGISPSLDTSRNPKLWNILSPTPCYFQECPQCWKYIFLWKFNKTILLHYCSLDSSAKNILLAGVLERG